MVSAVVCFAGIVQEQREVKEERPLNLLEKLAVMIDGWFGRFPNLVQFLDANESVLIRGVLMIKFVLHQAGQPAELRNIFPEKSHFVHGAEDRCDVSALVEDFEKCLADMFIFCELAVDERELIADGLREVRMQAV